MIRVNKTGHATPVILTTTGQTQRQNDEIAYLRNPNNYKAVSPHQPANTILFYKGIYGDDTVKNSLILIQNGKCCFCESKMRHVSDGDVEHFRPKGRWKQINGTPINYPGYYWKAYDWDNLYLACQSCNQREKQDLFPIEPRSIRATNHRMNIANERPSFLDPGDLNHDPENSIYFIGQFVSHHDNRGKITIKELGLDRTELTERREEKLEDILALEDCYLSSIGLANENDCRLLFFRRLKHYTSGLGEYSNMMKCNFHQYLPLL